MEAIAEGLWGLAKHHEEKGEIGKAIKCLEAICQSHVSFLPMVEVKSRLQIATLLLRHSYNVIHAKSHLERSLLLLKSIPSSFDLKFRTYSLLSQCYKLLGSFPPQKQILCKALELAASASPQDISVKLWSCNFNSQLANALINQGDYMSSLSALESGYASATQICFPELQMFFATSIMHVHIMQWIDDYTVEKAVQRCDEVWQMVPPERRSQCHGLHFYNEMLHALYRLRICDNKNAQQHVDRLDAAMKDDSQRTQRVMQLRDELNAVNQSLSLSNLSSRERSTLCARQAQIQDSLKNLSPSASVRGDRLEPAYFDNTKDDWTDRFELAPFPIDGQWLQKSAIYALLDLMVVICGRPKGQFKECAKRMETGMQIIEEELGKLGINSSVREVDLPHSTIWMASLYLVLLMHFLENKVALELTRSEFVEAQEALVQMKNWYMHFPTILQPSESVIEMLRGQYSHSVGCYSEAAFHYIEASKLTESKSRQAMCHGLAAISYLCIGDAESSSKALELIMPVYSTNNSLSGVREEEITLFAYGLLLMRQPDLQEARNQLAKGLQIAHNHLGNLQLISQYLTVLGNLALALRDPLQAREILRSSLTLAKKLFDIPTQIWVLSALTAMYRQLGERGNEMENDDYRRKKLEDLQMRFADARSSIHHIELISKDRLEPAKFDEHDIKRAMGGQSMQNSLDIPESVGISAPAPGPSSSRLLDLGSGRRDKRRF